MNTNTETAMKIPAVQDMALHDERYSDLLGEHEILNKRFLAILPTLTREQRDGVMDFLGLVFAMHLRLLELACGSDEKC